MLVSVGVQGRSSTTAAPAAASRLRRADQANPSNSKAGDRRGRAVAALALRSAAELAPATPPWNAHLHDRGSVADTRARRRRIPVGGFWDPAGGLEHGAPAFAGRREPGCRLELLETIAGDVRFDDACDGRRPRHPAASSLSAGDAVFVHMRAEVDGRTAYWTQEGPPRRVIGASR